MIVIDNIIMVDMCVSCLLLIILSWAYVIQKTKLIINFFFKTFMNDFLKTMQNTLTLLFHYSLRGLGR